MTIREFRVLTITVHLRFPNRYHRSASLVMGWPAKLPLFWRMPEDDATWGGWVVHITPLRTSFAWIKWKDRGPKRPVRVSKREEREIRGLAPVRV